MLDPDRLYLEFAFLMMFSWIWYHSLSVLHLRQKDETEKNDLLWIFYPSTGIHMDRLLKEKSTHFQW